MHSNTHSAGVWRPRWCVWWYVVISCVAHVNAMYCGDQNCYSVIGVTNSATNKEIKKAYRALSLKYHPDKNNDPGALDIFKSIANAYEIISDDTRRQEYDYALEHPEYALYNQYRYYQSELKIDWRVLLGVGVVFISLCQHYYWESSYAQAIAQVKQSTIYKNRLKGLEHERAQAAANSGGSRKGKPAKDRIKKEVGHTRDADEELMSMLDIHGSFKKHVVTDVLAIQLFFVPAKLGKLLWWMGRWVVRYWILRLEYLSEDADYMTRSTLRNCGLTPSAWLETPDEKKLELIDLQLWIPDNLKAYLKESRRDTKDRRKGKSVVKRQGSRTQLHDGEEDEVEDENSSPRKPVRKEVMPSQEQEVAEWLVSKPQEDLASGRQEQKQGKDARKGTEKEEPSMDNAFSGSKSEIDQSNGIQASDGWTTAQEQALRKAVKAFPKGCTPTEKDRWVRIAEAIPGKNASEAFKHMADLLERLRANKG
mmetsp:Transcript_19417/g.32632  ORF Transcript_19417/g.32632 Transcript_19417/m.32632 type:complete len:480 (-) Transcript_19417:92-1531(-)